MTRSCPIDPSPEEQRIQLWRDALVLSLSPETRRVLAWLHDPSWSGTEAEAVVQSMGRTLLERAAIRVYLEELTWDTRWGVPEKGGVR